jgi:hypothetical protein
MRWKSDLKANACCSLLQRWNQHIKTTDPSILLGDGALALQTAV